MAAGSSTQPSHRGKITMQTIRTIAAALVFATMTSVGLAQQPPVNPLVVDSPKPNYPRVSTAAGYAVVADWPQRPDAYTWGAMPGLAVDSQDRIWTFNRGDMPVQCYAADGSCIRAWGQGKFGLSHHVKIDKDDNVWLSDVGQHVVQKFSPSGELLMTLGTPGKYGEDATHLNKPSDVAIGKSGNLYVSDGYGNNRIVQFTPEGKFVRSWGHLGNAPGEFAQPHAVAADSQGRIYVVDRNNVRVQVFDAEGHFLSQWKNVITPWGITITPRDEIFVCGSSPMRWDDKVELASPPTDQLVMKFTPDGRIDELWTFPTTPEDRDAKQGELKWVHAIAVDSRGDIYLGDIHGRGAQKFRRLSAEGNEQANAK
jgi:hypothetical protein